MPSVTPEPDAELAQKRKQNDNMLKTRWEQVFARYEKDFSGVGDEINMVTGEVEIDNGHLRLMQDDFDIGFESTSPARFDGKRMLRAMTVASSDYSDSMPEQDEVLQSIEEMADNAMLSDYSSEDDLFGTNSRTQSYDDEELSQKHQRSTDSIGNQDLPFHDGSTTRSTSIDSLFVPEGHSMVEPKVEDVSPEPYLGMEDRAVSSASQGPTDGESDIRAQVRRILEEEKANQLDQEEQQIDPAWRIPVRPSSSKILLPRVASAVRSPEETEQIDDTTVVSNTDADQSIWAASARIRRPRREVAAEKNRRRIRAESEDPLQEGFSSEPESQPGQGFAARSANQTTSQGTSRQSSVRQSSRTSVPQEQLSDFEDPPEPITNTRKSTRKSAGRMPARFKSPQYVGQTSSARPELSSLVARDSVLALVAKTISATSSGRSADKRAARRNSDEAEARIAASLANSDVEAEEELTPAMATVETVYPDETSDDDFMPRKRQKRKAIPASRRRARRVDVQSEAEELGDDDEADLAEHYGIADDMDVQEEAEENVQTNEKRSKKGSSRKTKAVTGSDTIDAGAPQPSNPNKKRKRSGKRKVPLPRVSALESLHDKGNHPWQTPMTRAGNSLGKLSLAQRKRTAAKYVQTGDDEERSSPVAEASPPPMNPNDTVMAELQRQRVLKPMNKGICFYCNGDHHDKYGVGSHWDRVLTNFVAQALEEEDPHDIEFIHTMRSQVQRRTRPPKTIVYNYKLMVELHEGSNMSFDEISATKLLLTHKTGDKLKLEYDIYRQPPRPEQPQRQWSDEEVEKLRDGVAEQLENNKKHFTVIQIHKMLGRPSNMNFVDIGNKLAEMWLEEYRSDGNSFTRQLQMYGDRSMESVSRGDANAPENAVSNLAPVPKRPRDIRQAEVDDAFDVIPP